MPDVWVAADQVPQGRPWPWMIFKNMQELGVCPPSAVVKIGDTVADMEEAINADDQPRFEHMAQKYIEAQETWLIIARNMTPEKAKSVMIGFATGGELNKWLEENRPGPPPSRLPGSPRAFPLEMLSARPSDGLARSKTPGR